MKLEMSVISLSQTANKKRLPGAKSAVVVDGTSEHHPPQEDHHDAQVKGVQGELHHRRQGELEKSLLSSTTDSPSSHVFTALIKVHHCHLILSFCISSFHVNFSEKGFLTQSRRNRRS